MRIRTGTSGFSYKPWRGPFYPADLPPAEMLRFYAARFDAVEINNTFHRMPKEDLLARWAEQVPPHFAFALKASQRITHKARLVEAHAAVEYFFRAAAALGPRRGPVLFQLPPFLKRDVPRLAAFLDDLPEGARAAFEFRHASWFDDIVYGTLRERGAALCIADSETLETPFVATAPWGYLRLRRQDYGPADLAAWAERVRAQAWGEAFVFFKHEDAARGPALAEELQRLAA